MGWKALCGRRKVRMAAGMTGVSRSGFFETRSIWSAEGEDEDDGLSGTPQPLTFSIFRVCFLAGVSWSYWKAPRE
jgi:hypothetical protein